MAIDVEGNVVALGVAILAAFPAAWFCAKIGFKYAQQQEEEKEKMDMERSLGRVEGGGGRQQGGIDLFNPYTLGRMAANLESATSELTEVKRRLDNYTNELNELKSQLRQNRQLEENERREMRLSIDTQLSTFRIQQDALTSKVESLRSQVARILRGNRREQSND